MPRVCLLLCDSLGMLHQHDADSAEMRRIKARVKHVAHPKRDLKGTVEHNHGTWESMYATGAASPSYQLSDLSI